MDKKRMVTHEMGFMGYIYLVIYLVVNCNKGCLKDLFWINVTHESHFRGLLSIYLRHGQVCLQTCPCKRKMSRKFCNILHLHPYKPPLPHFQNLAIP